MTGTRAALYAALAEALAEPPAWLALPGKEWPLSEALLSMASESPAAAGAVTRLAAIAPEPLPARRARYQALFAGSGRPQFWLYESMHRTGSLLGPESYAVERLYRAAGLAIAGSELPDHASLELSFLAYLAVQREKHPAQERQWRRLERAFLRKHAGRWLPHLGSALAATGDVVYAPIGHLLADWLQEVSRSRPRRRTKRATTRLPVLTQAEACTLCGFCVQACPSGALTIDESRRETTLQLSPARCNACGRCERICRPGTLQLKRAPTAAAPLTLRRSPRARCPDCGAPTVSQAELKYVTEQIGPAPWLARCPDCRVQ